MAETALGVVIGLGKAIYAMAQGAKLNDQQAIALGEKVIGFTKQLEVMQDKKVIWLSRLRFF